MVDTPNENASDDNASIAPLLLGVIWSLGTVAVVVLFLRLYTAVRIVQRVKPEDYLMLAALLCALVQTCLLTVSVRWGLGRHIGTLSEEQVMHAAKFFILFEGWSVASTAFGRISFSVYLLQIVVINRMRKFLLYSFIAGQAIVNGLTIILIYVQCGTQPAAMWDPSIEADCWSPRVQRDFGFFQCSYNSLTDLFLTIFPIIIVWNLQLSWYKKLGISVLLGVSVVTFIESVIKGYSIKVLGEGVDVTWNIVPFLIWAVSEGFIIIIAASVPSLCPLVRKRRRTSTYQRTYEMDGSEQQRSKRGLVKRPDVLESSL
ncbi:hypothetical protein C8A01DRAFT_21439 [Parachaetomium inaequale]|uniref:Rhodopsin domain-containing protein n=1 Tax=Parachaetomium inaequale TaxID=2588326 RepID=A0AAN6P8B6_9PEZI|nr:hypothetical protein C8A01DRAFT_21439 [Parachaetomium inaequale]